MFGINFSLKLLSKINITKLFFDYFCRSWVSVDTFEMVLIALNIIVFLAGIIGNSLVSWTCQVHHKCTSGFSSIRFILIFHQCFTSSFYLQRSRKHKKDSQVVIFLGFWDLRILKLSYSQNVDEINMVYGIELRAAMSNSIVPFASLLSTFECLLYFMS